MRGWQAADPQRSVYHLRHEQLNEGGIWVSAPGSANRQRQLAARADEVSARLLLQLQGPPGPRPDAVVQAVGDMIWLHLGTASAPFYWAFIPGRDLGRHWGGIAKKARSLVGAHISNRNFGKALTPTRMGTL